MANQPFDRMVENVREKVLSSDFNQLQTDQDASLRGLMSAMFGFRPNLTPGNDVGQAPQGFLGDGFKVRPTGPASMNVVVTPGLGIQDDSVDTQTSAGGIVGLNDLQRSKILSLTNSINFPVPAPGGATRFDIVEVEWQTFFSDPTDREIFNPVTEQFEPNNVNKTWGWNLNLRTGQGAGAPPANAAIYYKVGTPGGGDPAVDAGYIKIARVQVDVAAVSIDVDRIVDYRSLIFPGGIGEARGFFTQASDLVGTQTLRLAAPPGMKALVVRNDNGALVGNVVLYLFPGGSPVVVSPQVTPAYEANVPADSPFVVTGSESTGTVSTAQAALFNGGNSIIDGNPVCATPILVAPGTPFWNARYFIPVGPPGPTTRSGYFSLRFRN